MALASSLGAITHPGVVMKIETPAFLNGNPIPKKYTCQGVDVSPPLFFSGAPEETVSFVLIVGDPDAPNGPFDHWLAWNIPGNMISLPESAKLLNQGINSHGFRGYTGPRPPHGKLHHYFFKLFALDTKLSLKENSTKVELEKAMMGHVLAKAEIIGTFQQ